MLVTVKSKRQLIAEGFYIDDHGDAWITESDHKNYRESAVSAGNYSWMHAQFFGKTLELQELIEDVGFSSNSPGMYNDFVIEELTPSNIPEYFL